MVARTDKSWLAEWWRTVDKPLLAAVAFLMLAGLMVSFAASPPVAERLGVDSLHFVKRHAMFLVPALGLFLACSLLDPRAVRRAAMVLFVFAVVALLATLFVGQEVKGSRRWLSVSGMSLQASEFVKPAFVIITAWLFAENSRRPDIPGNLFSIIVLAIVVALLMAQPDFGQTMLVAVVWGALFFMAGMSWVWILALSVVGIVGLASAYTLFPHIAGRINRFYSNSGDNFQVETGREAIVHGGWLGQGPGEGTVKRILPDGHTDFPFAVAAEEFGILLAIALVAVFAFVVLRGLLHALGERDDYVRLATAGLVSLFAAQSVIHLGVNLKLLPATGMTLPFISYGGSSLMASAIGMGFVAALTRSRPEKRRRRPVGFAAHSHAAGE